jgi:peptidoglycan/LPS O-acetylase OafA/YrhL
MKGVDRKTGSLTVRAAGKIRAKATLMSKSLDTSAPRAVKNRVRRLLPALWVMALILVPMMIVRGWPDRPSWRCSG